jgi:type IV pilus assembly protein PilF
MRHYRFAGVLSAVLLAALAAGCGTTQPGAVAPPPEPQIQPAVRPPQPQATPRQRAELHTDLAAGYFERGQMDVALEELAEAEKLDPSVPRIYNIYGLVQVALGESAKAESSFKRAIALAPEDSEIRHNWGWFLCSHGRPAEAIPEFEHAIRNPLYRTPEIALVNAGKCSALAGNSAAADGYFRRALALQPTHAGAAYNLALLHYKAGNLPDARALMRIVMLQTNPPPEALFLGLCIERKLTDRSAEQSYATQLRNRYPDSAETKAIVAGGCE